jgi:succinoglycan biosynthesis protein ExoM
VPAPDWLDQLLDAATRHGADVVTGPVFARFERPPPDWIIRGRFFEPRTHRDGAVVDYAYGGNVLWRAGLCRDGGNRFGEHYGLIGGSDSEFFSRLHRDGRKIVWAQRAVAFEFVPPDRCTARWLVRRMFRAGNAGVLVARDLDGDNLRTNVVLLCKAAAWLVIGAGQLLGGQVAGRHVRVRGRRHVAYGLGILAGLAGRRFEEYRAAHTDAP